MKGCERDGSFFNGKALVFLIGYSFFCSMGFAFGICPSITITLNSSANINCYGACNGSINVSASGGQSPYTYNWSSGNSGLDSISTALCAGSYAVIVTDANGCMDSLTGILITQPAQLNVPITGVVQPQCHNGTGQIMVSAVGGAKPYNFSWMPLGGSKDTAIVSSGKYKAEVIDSNGCVANSIDTSIVDPSAILVSLTTTPAWCGNANGTAYASPSGGTPPYNFMWTTGATSQSIGNLPAVTLTLYVFDKNNCSASKLVTINNASGPSVTIANNKPVSCFGDCNGSAMVNGSGGTTPYTFVWSDGLTGQAVSNLCSGIYSVTVNDVNGCSSSKTITITQPAALSDTISVINTTCGSSSGNAKISVSGGVAPYTFVWNNFVNDSMNLSLGQGTYIVTISDVNGCSFIDSAIVNCLTSVAADYTSRANFNIFPNPANEVVTIEFIFEEKENVLIELYNLLGEKLFQIGYLGNSQLKQQVSIANLEKGTYFIKIRCNENETLRKLVKQ